MPFNINKAGGLGGEFAQALAANDQEGIARAWESSMDAIAQRVKDDYAELSAASDAAAMAQRGYRRLTAKETRFYEDFAERARGTKQEFIDFFSDADNAEWMPETIIQDVFKHLPENHPLLSRVKFQYVGYNTKWILDDSAAQKGGWGKITDKITEEIEGALKVIDLSQNKYSAFCVIPMAIIDLGPAWMDSYIRAVLTEAIAAGLEDAIVNGTGNNTPCGLIYEPNSAFVPDTGYTKKTAVKVESFAPAAYGALIAKLAKTEKGKRRKFSKVQLICNMADYLTKVMPATTVLSAGGAGYVRDLFPFPTEVIQSEAVAEGSAVLCLLDEYTLAAGGRRNNVIEFDDSVGFLDHTRAFRCVGYYAGRAFDNTCALLLDISELDPAYITVEVGKLPPVDVNATTEKLIEA